MSRAWPTAAPCLAWPRARQVADFALSRIAMTPPVFGDHSSSPASDVTPGISRATHAGFRCGRAPIGARGLNTLIAGVIEGCEVEAGAGEEAVEQAGPVLHPFEPGLDQRGDLGQVAFGQVGQRSFQMGPDRFSRFAMVHGALDRRVRARLLSAGRGCFGWSSGLSGCGHLRWRGTARRWPCGRGHRPQMVALTRIPETELWTSFPEAKRNDVLRLLVMLLERLAVSAGPA